MVRRIWWCSRTMPLRCSLLEGQADRGDVVQHLLSGELSALQAQESGGRAWISGTQYVQSPGEQSALQPRGSSARARASGKQRAQRRLKEARGYRGQGN